MNENIILLYTCPAYPPENINMYKGYTLGNDKQGYYLISGEDKVYYELDFIKMLFTPQNKTWEEVDLDIK